MTSISPRAKRRLLVVDDDEAVARLLLRIARKAAFDARAISSPLELERTLDEAAPDLIFLDLNMPGVDGVEVLRKLSEGRCQSAIVLISGVDSRLLDATARLGREMGLNVEGALSKPIDVDRVRAILERQSLATRGPTRHPDDVFEITEERLREAIENDEMLVYFQPQVDLATGEVDGAEALVRWQDPERGMIPPGAFIPLAEETGLIVPLTYLVAEKAISEASAWGLDSELRISINLSPNAMTTLDLPDRIANLIREHDYDPTRVVIEVTESVAIGNPKTSMDILTRIRLKGMELSIDDFGTGTSSLSRLHQIPYGEIKIDTSFVGQALTNEDAAAIVKSTIDLGREMRLRVVAEGIEDEATADWLKRLGCDVGQGYYFSRPIPGPEFLEWIRDRRGSSSCCAKGAPRRATGGQHACGTSMIASILAGIQAIPWLFGRDRRLEHVPE